MDWWRQCWTLCLAYADASGVLGCTWALREAECLQHSAVRPRYSKESPVSYGVPLPGYARWICGLKYLHTLAVLPGPPFSQVRNILNLKRTSKRNENMLNAWLMWERSTRYIWFVSLGSQCWSMIRHRQAQQHGSGALAVAVAEAG